VLGEQLGRVSRRFGREHGPNRIPGKKVCREAPRCRIEAADIDPVRTGLHNQPYRAGSEIDGNHRRIVPVNYSAPNQIDWRVIADQANGRVRREANPRVLYGMDLGERLRIECRNIRRTKRAGDRPF